MKIFCSGTSSVRTSFPDLVLYRSCSELRAERKRSMAGFLWWIFRPLMQLGVYAVVFGVIFKNSEPHFMVFLFSGIIAWEWFAGVVVRSSNSVIANRPLMLLVKVNPALFPLSYAIVDGVKFLPGLAILLAGCVASGVEFHSTLLLLPVLVLVQVMLCAGAGMMVASITPLFPDFHMFLLTAIQLLMFMSGIFYRIDRLPARFATFMRFNPMASLISQYRAVVVDGVFPSVWMLLYVLAFGLLMSAIGYLTLQRLAGVYTKRW